MKVEKLPFLIAATVLLLVTSTEGFAVSVTTADGNGADTYIQSSLSNNAANQNFGSSTDVLIKHDAAIPGNNRKGYLRFDLSSVTDSITGATLELTFSAISTDPTYPNANPSTYNVYGLVDGDPGENWNESTITWNNAPGNDTSSPAGVLSSDTTFLGSFSMAVAVANIGDLISFSSPSLLSFLQNDSNDLLTFIVTRQQTNFSIEAFASKENSTFTPPTLVLTTAEAPPTVPEPGTLALLGLGIVGIGYQRRRRMRA